MIFDHIVLIISDADKSKNFYLNALLPLDITLIREDDGCIGFGTQNKPSLWICKEDNIQKPMHIAFIAESRKAVDEFHAAALKAGGKDNGAPGIRANYHPIIMAHLLLIPMVIT